MKKLFLSLVFGVFAFADVLKVSDFQTDIYSKAGQNLTKKISMNLEVVGRDVEDNEAYVLDALKRRCWQLLRGGYPNLNGKREI